MNRELRVQSLEDAILDRNILSLPVLFKGSHAQCIEAARNVVNWRWKQDKNMLFQGYWVDHEGNCIYLT